MANQRKIGVVFGYANIVVKNVVNLLYTPMLLAFMGQGEYGVFQTCYQFVISLQLLSFGLSGAYVRFFMQKDTVGDEAGIQSLNGIYLVLYFLICVVAVVMGLAISGFCGMIFAGSFTPNEVSLASVLISVMTFNVATVLFSCVFDAYIIAHECFVFQQTRQMLTTLATPILALMLLMMGAGAVGVAIAQFSINVALLLLNARYAIIKIGMRFTIRNFDKGLLKALIVFSSWIFINQLTDLLTMNLPSVVLGAISGATVVAVFAVSMQLRSLFYSLSTTLSSIFVPLVNRIVVESDDSEALTRLMTRVGRYQAMLYCWVLGGFILLGQWFIRIWAGEAFSDAYWLLLIMVVPLTVPLVQNVGIEIQKARNRHKARSLIYLGCALLNLVITAVLANSVGYWAAAIGFAAYIIAGACVFMNWYYQNRLGLDMFFFWKKIFPVFLACVVATTICCVGRFWFPVTGLVQFFAWGFVYTVVYFLLVWALALSKKEKRSVFGKLGGLKRR